MYVCWFVVLLLSRCVWDKCWSRVVGLVGFIIFDFLYVFVCGQKYNYMVFYYLEPLFYLSGVSDFFVYYLIDTDFKKYVKSVFKRLPRSLFLNFADRFRQSQTFMRNKRLPGYS